MEIKNQILSALQAIEIDTSNLKDEDKLGDGVGMDSQEMAEFLLTLEKNLNIKLPDNFFHKQMTIKEASIKLSEHPDLAQ
jgi:acyl carrier protein